MATDVGRRAIRIVRNLPDTAVAAVIGARCELGGAFRHGVIDGAEGAIDETAYVARGTRPTDAVRLRRWAYLEGYTYGRGHAAELVA